MYLQLRTTVHTINKCTLLNWEYIQHYNKINDKLATKEVKLTISGRKLGINFNPFCAVLCGIRYTFTIHMICLFTILNYHVN